MYHGRILNHLLTQYNLSGKGGEFPDKFQIFFPEENFDHLISNLDEYTRYTEKNIKMRSSLNHSTKYPE